MSDRSRSHLVIAGGGQAAVQAAQSARQAGYDGSLTIVAEEACLPYQRPPLSKKFLAGELPADRLALKPADFYRTRDIEMLLGNSVESVDIRAKSVSLENGDAISFTHLLLATGSVARRLNVPGSERAGIYYLRTIADVEKIKPEFENGKTLVIVGAGYIGLEVAAVAVGAGLDVVVLEIADQVLGRAVCATVADFYADYHRRAGVDLRLNSEVRAFRGDSAVREVETTDGERIACDFAIIGVGAAPRVGLAGRAGLGVDIGINVDEHGRTAVAGIYAAGDCTSHPHPWVGRRVRLESVQNAIEQGKAAGSTIAGAPRKYDAIPWFWSDQYDLKLQIAGLAIGYDSTVVRGDVDSGRFSVYYLASGRVIAVDSINDSRSFVSARQLLATKPRLPADAIADTDSDLASWAG